MRRIHSAHPRGHEPNWFARRHLIKPVLFVALGWLLAVLAFAAPASPQAFKRDNGHCVTVDEAGKPRSPVTIPVPACWNFAAGAAMRETADDYPEQRPFLDGWDFRINLPHVRFQLASPGAGSGPTIAGVIEATESAESPDGTLLPSEGGYGHRNNSLWLFRTRAAGRRAFFKLLPSRRSYGSATTTNVRSLTSGWVRVGPAASPTLAVERPSVAVLGEGVPGTTVYVVARDADGELHFTRHAVTSLAPAWPDRWRRLGFRAAPRPSLSAAHDGRLVLAWTDPSTSRVRAALYTPSSDSWSAPVDVGGPAAGAPQAVWDGATLHVLFVDAATRRLRDTVAVSPLVFREPADASQIAVRGNRFDAIPFNGRIHAAFAQDGPGAATSVWYAASVSPPGFPAFWAAPSPVGFSTIGDPEIVSLYENLLVIGTRLGGKVQFARKDPNATEETTPGGSVWLSPSATVDSSIAGAFRDLDALSFNGDAYLAAAKTPSAADPRGAYVVNVGRRAMKQLITGKWGITLTWGAAGTVIDKGGFALGSQIPSVGDFDGDGKRDAVRFTQTREGTMPAPVYVARSTGSDLEQDPTPWHKFFSLKGEIPAVGDFNGDGKDDIVTFVQKQQRYADGSPIGPAPVWVSLSNGSRFQTSRIWHKFFSLKGEIPAVGDFNGDGKDDIVTFVQKQQRYADGSPIGPAPVWVSLSNGSRFQTSRIWHADFGRGQALARVGDMNLDGRDDVLSFTRATVSGERARDVYAAASRGNRFGPEAIWHSDFVAKDELPFVTSLAGRTLSALTGDSDDDTPTADVIAFAKDGAVRVAESFSAVPYPSGAPWERYKWFTEKGLGVALYPEWLYRQGPDHCVARDHRFVLRGASGIGGGSVTASSVRLGGRAGHISQELGHSLFANCLDETDGDPDVFNLYEPVYQTPPTSGGIGANAMPGCPEEARWEAQEPSVAGYDCRDPEHYFLGLLEDYRLNGDEFRREIAATTDPARKARLRAQYLWIRLNWFRGTEFKRGPAIGSTLTLDGLQCLIGDCPLG